MKAIIQDKETRFEATADGFSLYVDGIYIGFLTIAPKSQTLILTSFMHSIKLKGAELS